MSCKCNNCDKIFFEDSELELLKEEDEFYKWCDECKTDWYLSDIKCIYCEGNPKESTHFLCEKCWVWMCDDCYDHMVEHTGHYHQICESCDDEQYDQIMKHFKHEPDYLCEECLSYMWSRKRSYSKMIWVGFVLLVLSFLIWKTYVF